MNASYHHPVLIVAVPLAFAVFCPILGIWKRRLCFTWSLIGLAATAFFTWTLVGRVPPGKPVVYSVGGWSAPWGIQLRVDYFGLFAACAVTGIGIILFVYYFRFMGRDLKADRIPYCCALYLLSIAGMLGFCVTGDLFSLFIFMEVFSIASYALVAVTGETHALQAAFKYLLVGVTSSATFVLAIGLLYSVVGSLDMRDVSLRLKTMDSRFVPVSVIALVLFLVALSAKSAVFPLHWWFPDAAGTAFDPESSLLSSLVLAMGVFGVFRILFSLYAPGFSGVSAWWRYTSSALAWIAAFSIVAFAAKAVFQRDLKYMAAYSALSQAGVALLGITVLSPHGTAGSFYAVLACACGGGCLFLVAGAFMYKHGIRRIADLRGLGRTMPVTAGAFALASLSVLGVPFTVGYNAKELLLRACFDKGLYVFAAALLLGTALAAVYLGRVAHVMFASSGSRFRGIDEAPATVYGTAALLSLGAVIIGVLSPHITPALRLAARIIFSK